MLVLGGGPAGSLAATLLSRGGIDVTLVEQHRFPRNKVCGECLSSLGRGVLRRHQLENQLLAVGRELFKTKLFGANNEAEFKLPSPMLGVSRSFMDQHLLSAAVAAGCKVRQPARVERLESGPNSVLARVRELSTNAIEEWTVDQVFVADGRGAWLNPKPAPTSEMGLKAHFQNIAADPEAITLFGGTGCYGGVAPIEGDRWNVAFSVPKAWFGNAKGDLNALWASIVEQSPQTAKHFKPARRVSDWIAAPLPRHAVMSPWPEKIVPIGAAACAIEPVGGEGMGTALRSAELAVEAFLPANFRPYLTHIVNYGGSGRSSATWEGPPWLMRIGAIASHSLGILPLPGWPCRWSANDLNLELPREAVAAPTRIPPSTKCRRRAAR